MESNRNRDIAIAADRRRQGMRGISLPEILIVFIVVAIMMAISLPYLLNYNRLYKTEDEALKMMDLMREASQFALTRRRFMRLEVDLTDNKVLLIDENKTGAADDVEVKAIPLENVREVRLDRVPAGITVKPVVGAGNATYNDAAFAADTTGHKSGNSVINGHNVWAIRFKSDGSVVDKNGVLTSANLYFWQPLAPGVAGNHNAKDQKMVRAVTIFGGSGAVRYWKYDGTAFVPY